MTYGAATAGEVLVDRYRLEEHIDTDAAGRLIWRGVDVVLRRPVALVIRQPGGEQAAGMLTAAVAASRIVHPHLVSVYDAIDEGHRAYLVREWVPGVALRDVLGQGPLDGERATLVTHAVAEAVAALHVAGIVHGNVHPGTILVADDGRVVLLDAHADAPSDPEFDVRAVGAVLYACLTGHWPYAEAGRSALPDAPRDGHGHPARPHQVRGGVPRHLDEIAAELLDPQVAPPEAAPLAAEFARLAATEDGYEGDDYAERWDDPGDPGPMGFRADGGGRRRGTGKLVAGVAALVVVAAVGIYGAINLLSGSNDPDSLPTNPGPTTTTNAAPQPIAISPGQVRIVDPPGGNRAEIEGAEVVVDGDLGTGWSTDEYFGPADFGGIKPGMGILINLGSAMKVDVVQVTVAQTGATLELRSGTADPGSSSEGDSTIEQTYTVIGAPIENAGTTAVFQVPPDHEPTQYLMVWISNLPPTPDGKFQITVNEIEVKSSTP
jgi:hypothetical protein